MKIKKFEFVILVAFIFSIFISDFLIFINHYDNLKDKVIRLHILANSNSLEDQRLKYKLKDDISKRVSYLVKDIKTKKEAKKIIIKEKPYLEKLLKTKIKSLGYNYDLKIALANSYFNTREYKNFTLPAGKYETIKIIIGEGKGKNWWCVAFPPMCNPLYNNEQNNQDILGFDELNLIKNPCKYKFAIVELITNIKQKLDILKKRNHF